MILKYMKRLENEETEYWINFPKSDHFHIAGHK